MEKRVKARVTVAFTDKNNLMNAYSVGDTFEGIEERVSELANGGYVEKIDEPKTAPDMRKAPQKEG